MFPRALLPTLLMLIAGAAVGQTHREQITVNLVEVPVYLEGLTARELPRLTRDDFELFVNGRRHAVHYFDVIDESAPAATDPSNPRLERRRLVVLLFDPGASSMFGVNNAKQMAAEFVKRAPASFVFSVGVVGRKGVHFLTPFTTDRESINRAVSSLSPQPRDPLNLITRSAGAEPSWSRGDAAAFTEAWLDQRTQGGFDSSVAAAAALDTSSLETEMEEAEARGKIEHLGALADDLAPLSGVKEVILLSEGIAMQDPTETFGLRSRLSSMHRRYRAAGVVLHAVDAAGGRAPFSSPGYNENLKMSGSIPGSLYGLALDTGGAVKSSLHRLQQIQRLTYILGFNPQGPQKKQNSIRIRVKNVPWGTIVRHRRSYVVAEKGPRRNDALLLADTLMNDIAQDGVSVGVRATMKGEGIEVAAAIPGRELLAMATDTPILFDVFFYIFNSEHQVADWHYARVSVDAGKGREFLSANAFTIRKDFALPAGRYSAKALIRVVGSDIRGFGRADLVVEK